MKPISVLTESANAQPDFEWPSLDALFYFEVLAQSPSLSAAAKQLGLTQQALSKSLAQLEGALQVQLLKRRPLGLTPAGECLLKQTQAILNPCRQLESRFAHLPAAAQRTPLKVGLPSCLAATVLQAFQAQQAQKHLWGPLHLICDGGPQTSPHDSLQTDLDLLLWPQRVESDRLACRFWIQTRFCLVGRFLSDASTHTSTHAIARDSKYASADAGFVFSSLTPSFSETQLLLPHWPDPWQAFVPEPFMPVPQTDLPGPVWADLDLDTCLDLLLTDANTAPNLLLWVPEYAVKTQLASGKLQLLPHAPPGPLLDLYWVWNPAKLDEKRLSHLFNLPV
ncbi:MAG: LysR family transcriptional regulator [Candidatus Sericytochromatia bacterium]